MSEQPAVNTDPPQTHCTCGVALRPEGWRRKSARCTKGCQNLWTNYGTRKPSRRRWVLMWLVWAITDKDTP